MFQSFQKKVRLSLNKTVYEQRNKIGSDKGRQLAAPPKD